MARRDARDVAARREELAVQAAHREALRLDGEIVATLHGLADPPGRDGRRVCFSLSGFDPAFERLGPGLLLVGHKVEAAIAKGMACADVLRDREAYKYVRGAEDTPTFRRLLRGRG